jgi:hypothetical protein
MHSAAIKGCGRGREKQYGEGDGIGRAEVRLGGCGSVSRVVWVGWHGRVLVWSCWVSGVERVGQLWTLWTCATCVRKVLVHVFFWAKCGIEVFEFTKSFM